MIIFLFQTPLTSIYLQHEGQKTWMLHYFGCCFNLNWKSQLTSSYNIPTGQVIKSISLDFMYNLRQLSVLWTDCKTEFALVQHL